MEELKTHIQFLKKRLDKLEHEHAFDSGSVSSLKSIKLLGRICELEEVIEGLEELDDHLDNLNFNLY